MQIQWRNLMIAMLTLLVPGLLQAQDAGSYQCTYGDLTRRVEIVTEPGVSVPCEVHYFKDSEAPGDKQVLWRAENEAGFCEARTREFIAQMTEWGWSCVDSMVPATDDSGVDDAADDAVDNTVDDSASGETG